MSVRVGGNNLEQSMSDVRVSVCQMLSTYIVQQSIATRKDPVVLYRLMHSPANAGNNSRTSWKIVSARARFGLASKVEMNQTNRCSLRHHADRRMPIPSSAFNDITALVVRPATRPCFFFPYASMLL